MDPIFRFASSVFKQKQLTPTSVAKALLKAQPALDKLPYRWQRTRRAETNYAAQRTEVRCVPEWRRIAES
jgi:hypothetical protein